MRIVDALVNLWRLARNVARRLFGRPPDFVWIEVSGSLPEFETPAGFLRRRLARGPAPLSLEALRTRFDRILRDGRPRGVVLRIRRLDAGWATLEELRREVGRFRGRGGRVVAFLAESADTRSYYAACAADEILATPLATVGVTGVTARVNFFKDALEKLGVEADVVAVSPYKSAGDPFVRNDFSAEARAQTERLLDGRYAEVTRAISEGRGLTAEEARSRVDGAPYAAKQAVSAGLLDGVCYEDELPGRLGTGGANARLAEWGRASGALRLPYRRRPRRGVGLVGVTGTIATGASRNVPVPLPFVGGERAGSDSVVAALRVAEKSRRVAAVLLHVDSPGGDALASDLIWREVRRVSGRKPVVVLMGNAAASGGYYVAAPAAHVVSRAATLTGSIGVLAIRPSAGGLYGKLGVNPAVLGRGERADLQDFSRPASAEELGVLEGQIGNIYGEFKERVSGGRGIGPDEVEELAGGRVWTGAEALERGLVDEIGGFREALGRARELAGIDRDDPEVLVRIPVPRRGRPAPGDPSEAVEEVLAGIGRAAAELKSGGAWALAPYRISGDR